MFQQCSHELQMSPILFRN